MRVTILLPESCAPGCLLVRGEEEQNLQSPRFGMDLANLDERIKVTQSGDGKEGC